MLSHFILSLIFFSTFIFCLLTTTAARTVPATFNIGFLSSRTSNGIFDLSGSQSLQAMIMALNEVNNKTDGIADDLLPGSTLRFAARPPKRTFSVTVASAQYLAATAFGGKGIIAAIGPASPSGVNPITAAALLFNDYNVLEISHGAYYSQVSFGTTYNYLMRTIPTNSFQGRTLASLCYELFQWKKIAVLGSTDFVSANAASEFLVKASDYGMTVLTSVQFSQGETNYASYIETVKKTGAQIFVLFMTPTDAAALLTQGHAADIFTEGTQILGMDTLSTYLLPHALLAMNDQDHDKVNKIMKGFITLSSVVNGEGTDERQAFVDRWRSQASTAGYFNSNGQLVCNRATDMDTTATGSNIYYLYEDYLNSSVSSKVCAGYDFATYFTPTGSNILATALYAYDAVHALARGIHNLYYHTNLPMSAANLKQVMIKNVSFVGATGHVSFSKGTQGSLLYAEGDRQGGVKFKVLNYQPDMFDSSSTNYTGFVKVGTWLTETAFTPCDATTDSSCYSFVYNTPTTVDPPLDAPVVITVSMAIGVQAFIYFLAAVAMLSATVFIVISLFYRHTKVMKASQPVLLSFILIGVILCGIRAMLGALPLSDSVCQAEMWTGHLAFLLVFTALVIKSYRIHLLVNGKAFRRIKITPLMTLMTFMSILMVFIIYLIVVDLVGHPNVRTLETTNKLQVTEDFTCHDKVPGVQMSLFVIEGIMLAFGLYLSYATRDAPDIVNESNYIATATVIISFVSLIAFPAVFLLNLPYITQRLIVSVVFGLSGISVAMVLFGPKLHTLISKGDLKIDKKFLKNLKKVQPTNGPQKVACGPPGDSRLASQSNVSGYGRDIEKMYGVSNNNSNYNSGYDNSNTNHVTSNANGGNSNVPSIRRGSGDENEIAKNKITSKLQECREQMDMWKKNLVYLQQMYDFYDQSSLGSSSSGGVFGGRESRVSRIASLVQANRQSVVDDQGNDPTVDMYSKSLKPGIGAQLSHIPEGHNKEGEVSSND